MGSRSFIWGTLSPVSDASLSTAEPRNTTQSQGTTCAPAAAPAGAAGLEGGAAPPAAAPPGAAAAATAVAGGGAGLASLTEMRSPGSSLVVESLVCGGGERHGEWVGPRRAAG